MQRSSLLLLAWSCLLACTNAPSSPLGIRRASYAPSPIQKSDLPPLRLCQWFIADDGSTSRIGICGQENDGALADLASLQLQLLHQERSIEVRFDEQNQLTPAQWEIDVTALNLAPHQGELILIEQEKRSCLDYLTWGGQLPAGQSLKPLCTSFLANNPEQAKIRATPYPMPANTTVQLQADGQVDCATFTGQLTALPSTTTPCPTTNLGQVPPVLLTEITSERHSLGAWLELQANPNSPLFAQDSNASLDLRGLRLCHRRGCQAITQPGLRLTASKPLVLALGSKAANELPADWIWLGQRSPLLPPGPWQEIALFGPQDGPDHTWPLWAYGAFANPPLVEQLSWPSTLAIQASQADLWPSLETKLQPILPLAPTWPADSLARAQDKLGEPAMWISQATPAAPNLAGDPNAWAQCSANRATASQPSSWRIAKLDFLAEQTQLELHYLGPEGLPAATELQLETPSQTFVLQGIGPLLPGERRVIIISPNAVGANASTYHLLGKLAVEEGSVQLRAQGQVALFLAWQVTAASEPLGDLAQQAIDQGKWPADGCRIPRPRQETIIWHHPGTRGELPSHYSSESAPTL